MSTNNEIQDLCKQVETMVDNENWDGIRQMLSQYQQTADSNVLHVALRHNASMDVISNLINIGGKDVVTAKDRREGRNALHLACYSNVSIELVLKLIEVGGTDLVFDKDQGGCNSLHYAYEYSASVEIISKLISLGGRKLVFAQDRRHGRNSLHVACDCSNVSIEAVSKLIEVGGTDLVLAEDKFGRNALEVAFGNNLLPNHILAFLIQYGGEEVLIKVNEKGNNTLLNYYVITNYFESFLEERTGLLVERVSNLINRGIELKVGGEYAIGGLFTCRRNQQVRNKIYDYWDEVLLPALERTMDVHNNQRHRHILRATILSDAPPHVIKDVINCFPDSINTPDCSGKYPIDIAVQHGLTWDGGMEDIVEAFASAEETTELNVCSKHGVQWENGMVNMMQRSHVVDIVERMEVSTGLYPFMLAAVGEKYSYDLGAIYHLIKSSPKLVQHFGADNVEEKFSGKRKRSFVEKIFAFTIFK